MVRKAAAAPVAPSEPAPRPTWVWWTSGKDAAWVLQVLQSDRTWAVRGLLAFVTSGDGRSWLHGVRRELLVEQSAAAGLALRTIEVEPRDDPPSYDRLVREACGALRSEGATFMAFGDLTSSRRRRRRTQLLQGTGLEAVFPLWGRNPLEHAREMIGAGLVARVCSVVPTDLPASRVGARFDQDFLDSLPGHIDPCGENDEFHTFVEWAPGWRHRVAVAAGSTFERYGLVFTDIRPAGPGPDDDDECQGNVGGDCTAAPRDPFDYFRRLRRLRTHVDENLGDDLSVARAAGVAGLAPSSFRRYFRQRAGVSYGVWLARRRMERAAGLLLKSDASVEEVGMAVGYPVRRSLRRAFRRQFGRSPSRYREETMGKVRHTGR